MVILIPFMEPKIDVVTASTPVNYWSSFGVNARALADAEYIPILVSSISIHFTWNPGVYMAATAAKPVVTVTTLVSEVFIWVGIHM